MPSQDSKDSVETRQQRGGGFLGFLLPRKTKKVVKADLGEKNSFYYDESSKQWIEKGSSGITVHNQILPPPSKTDIKSHQLTGELSFTQPTLTRTSSLDGKLQQKYVQSQFQVTSSSKQQGNFTPFPNSPRTTISNVFIPNVGDQQTVEADENYSGFNNDCRFYDGTMPIGVKRRKQSLDENQDHSIVYDEKYTQIATPFDNFKNTVFDDDVQVLKQDKLHTDTKQSVKDCLEKVQKCGSNPGESLGWIQDRTVSEELDEDISTMHYTKCSSQNLNPNHNIVDYQKSRDGNVCEEINQIKKSPQEYSSKCDLLCTSGKFDGNTLQEIGHPEVSQHFQFEQVTNSVQVSDAYTHYMDWMNNRWYSYIAGLDCEEQDRLTRDSVYYEQRFNDWVGQVYIEYYQLYPDYYDQLFVQPSKQVESPTQDDCLTVCRSKEMVFDKQEVTIEHYPSLDSWVVKDASPKKRARNSKEGKLAGPTPWNGVNGEQDDEENSWVIPEEGGLQQGGQHGHQKCNFCEEQGPECRRNDIFNFLDDKQVDANFASQDTGEENLQFSKSVTEGCIYSNGIQNPLFDLRSSSFTSLNAEAKDVIPQQEFTDFGLDKQQTLIDQLSYDFSQTAIPSQTDSMAEEIRPITPANQDLHSIVDLNVSSSSTPRDCCSQDSSRQAQSMSTQQLQQIEQRLQLPCSSRQAEELQEQLRQSRLEIHSHQIQINDLLVALGQESAKVQKLREMLVESGVDEDEIEKVLRIVEEEVGWGDDSDSDDEVEEEKQD
eukprot:TRINITY_DN332_c0_g2_i1.p1 TRINITY_DN332_c0_g2~~TRINITY_DN332_c0_g2_i1.p1  ORF type:complete len:769 (-),score=110.73 TRINITY_DN332_c0_g2_i1:314-2620(-)